MTRCQICNSPLNTAVLSCSECNITYSGTFFTPRLARLSPEEQQLAEALIVHGGNLKEMSGNLEISYPTLKKRLNQLADSLNQKEADDQKKIAEILLQVESGTVKSEEGIRMIKELSGEL